MQMEKISKSWAFYYKMEMRIYFNRLLKELSGCYLVCSKYSINAGFLCTLSWLTETINKYLQAPTLHVWRWSRFWQYSREVPALVELTFWLRETGDKHT